MKLTHKEKVKLAKKMGISKIERKMGVGVFMTKAWWNRKFAIINRINKKNGLKKLHNESPSE